MTWAAVLEIVRAESEPATAARIEARLLRDLAGVRLSIPVKARPLLTPDAIQKALRAANWRVDEAAKALDVHPRTLYRHLEARRKQIRQAVEAGTFNGRLVR